MGPGHGTAPTTDHEGKSASNILGGGGDAKDLFDNIEDVGYDVSEFSATMANLANF